jgi:hypothetical protein
LFAPLGALAANEINASICSFETGALEYSRTLRLVLRFFSNCSKSLRASSEFEGHGW